MAVKKVEFSSKLLQTLHHLHSLKADLANQLERGPRQIKAGEAMVAKAQADADTAKEVKKKAQIASDEKQLQLKEREDHITQIQGKLNAAASNREFDTFKEQIAADEQANSVLSDEILESFDHLDVLAAELKAAEDELAKQKTEHTKRIKDVEERLAKVRIDAERVAVELAEAEKEIPSAAKADYVRLSSSRGEEAIAPIDDHNCGGCYQTLTTMVIDQLRLSVMVKCPNCNAFLYAPTGTQVR